jgi:hypothetical protein
MLEAEVGVVFVIGVGEDGAGVFIGVGSGLEIGVSVGRLGADVPSGCLTQPVNTSTIIITASINLLAITLITWTQYLTATKHIILRRLSQLNLSPGETV